MDVITLDLEETLSEAFNGDKVYVEIKVKSYGKPRKEILKALMRSNICLKLEKGLFISSMTSNESSNEEDTRYNTELKFTESI